MFRFGTQLKQEFTVMMTSLSLSEFVQDLDKILKHSPPERSAIEEKVQALFREFVEETKDLHNREALINKADKYKQEILNSLDTIVAEMYQEPSKEKKRSEQQFQEVEKN